MSPTLTNFQMILIQHNGIESDCVLSGMMRKQHPWTGTKVFRCLVLFFIETGWFNTVAELFELVGVGGTVKSHATRPRHSWKVG